MQPLSCDHLLMSVPQLDKQHRELIAEVNEFSAAVDAGASRFFPGAHAFTIYSTLGAGIHAWTGLVTEQ